MKAVFIIPAYNEETTIASVIQGIKQAHPQSMVLVINDASPDQTAMVARNAGAFVLTIPFNIGIGGVVGLGLKLAVIEDFDYVIRLDGDGQHPPEEIPKVLDPIVSGEVEVAFGSRFILGAYPPKINLTRRLGIKMFSWLASTLTREKITDPTSGLMAMNKEANAFLASNLGQDYPEVEARILLARAGFRTREYPVNMRIRQGGTSSINTWESFYYMLKVTLSCFVAQTRKLQPPFDRNQFLNITDVNKKTGDS